MTFTHYQNHLFIIYYSARYGAHGTHEWVEMLANWNANQDFNFIKWRFFKGILKRSVSPIKEIFYYLFWFYFWFYLQSGLTTKPWKKSQIRLMGPVIHGLVCDFVHIFAA